MLTRDDFLQELKARFRRAEERGLTVLEVNSGDLHRSLGIYPAPDHRMSVCCDVMYAELRAGDQTISAPPKGKGASLTIRYLLPR